MSHRKNRARVSPLVLQKTVAEFRPVGITCSSPLEPGTPIAPGLREDGRTVQTVGFTSSSPPGLGMCIAPGPREDGRTSSAGAARPREPGGRNALGPCVDDISRNISLASSTI